MKSMNVNKVQRPPMPSSAGLSPTAFYWRNSSNAGVLYELIEHLEFYNSFHCRFIFLGIYSLEMVIRVVAKGFILNNYTYLRSPWNWLDFLVIFSGYLTSFIEMGNLAGLRTFRVLRALKTISILPSKRFQNICTGFSGRPILCAIWHQMVLKIHCIF